MAHQRAGRRAGLRHGAILRLSGAAHQQAQRRTDTNRRDTPSPRAEPAVSDRAALASGRVSWEWVGPAGTLSAAGLLANAAIVVGKNGPPGGPGGDQVAKVTGPMRRRFAQVTG